MALFKGKKAKSKYTDTSLNTDTDISVEDISDTENDSDEQVDSGSEREASQKEVEQTKVSQSGEEEIEEADMFDNGVAKETKPKQRDIAELVDEVLDYFTIAEPIKLNMLERGKLKKELFVNDVKEYIKQVTTDDEIREKVFKDFSAFIWSYDILDELIADDSISDIKVYDWDRIRIKVNGKRKACALKFRNERHFLKFVEHVALKNKVSISDQNAAQNFVDKESCESAILRFNITTGFINSSSKPILHIRKILKTKLTREQLIELGFFTDKVANYLEDRIQTGEGFLFCGKGASGKTTCMNYLIDKIPEEYSGLVIQENEELFSDHPDLAFEHTVTNRGEGKIEYTLQDLARNGLLTDIDFFIIGEIKGGEALYLLNAVYTGARGWASVHGASATEAMKKLVDYIKYNSDYSQEEALQMLLHLNTVVFMEDFKVKEITEVTGYDAETGNLTYKKVL